MIDLKTTSPVQNSLKEDEPILYADFMVYWDGLFWKLFDSYRGKDPKEVLKVFLLTVWQESELIAIYQPDHKPGWSYLVTLFTAVCDSINTEKAKKQVADMNSSYDIWSPGLLIKDAKGMAHFFLELVLEFYCADETDWQNDDVSFYWHGLHCAILDHADREPDAQPTWNDIAHMFLKAVNYD